MKAENALLASVALFVVGLFALRGTHPAAAEVEPVLVPPRAHPPGPGAPAPRAPATGPTVPTERPRPRAVPKTVQLQALTRYRFELDVLPVEGLSELAEKFLPYMGLAAPEIVERHASTRNGVEVTRLTLDANVLVSRTVPLDREFTLAGVGSVWVIAAEPLGKM